MAGGENFCNNHTEMCVNVAEAMKSINDLKEYVDKMEERIMRTIDELKDDSERHFSNSKKLEIAMAEIKVTIEKLDKTMGEYVSESRNMSKTTEQILTILQRMPHSPDESPSDRTTNKLIDAIRDISAGWKVIIIVILVIVGYVVGIDIKDWILKLLGI